MSISYTYNPNWINRDTQPDGSALRVVKAADFEAEWVSIQNAFTQAIPSANASLTGTTSIENLTIINDVAVTGDVTGANLNVVDWDSAFSWGDHSVAGYALAADVPPSDGTGATGTWDIDITGNAATATTATTASNVTRSVFAGTNLSGGGQLSENRTINLVDSPSVTSLVIGNFTLIDNGGTSLYLQYNGLNVIAFDSDGRIRAEGDIWASDSL